MTFAAFSDSVHNPNPPDNLPPLLQALWYDAKGDWEMSHNIAQDIATADGSWVHAYLHRKEGDQGNAAYWYGRAGKSLCQTSLEEEWQSIATMLLKKPPGQS